MNEKGRPATPTTVCLEMGARRVFASALDWPGWCRSGRDEELALKALADAASRYSAVTAVAGIDLPVGAAGAFDVVERLPGSATTDYGAPAAVAASEVTAPTREEAARIAALVAASWSVLEQVAAGAPAELVKGPRGGGRDRDAIVQHVLGAEAMYARKLGIRLPEPALEDGPAIEVLRASILEALRAAATAPAVEKGWPVRYAARRIAWHALDHAWEIEDRSSRP